MNERNNKIFLSIITATYNREKLLSRLYRGLYDQSMFDFEWIVIDDGSNDNTKLSVESLNADRFDIIYRRKGDFPNGKHRAINYSHQFISGDFVCILDSDDVLLPDAIQTINKDLLLLRDKSLVGISYLSVDFQGRVIGRRHKNDFLISDFFDERYSNNTYGDKFEVWRTDVFTNHKFPEINGEVFFPEGFLWLKMADKQRVLFRNKATQKKEYQLDGISMSARKIHLNNPIGMIMYYEELLSKQLSFIQKFKYRLLKRTFFMANKIKNGEKYKIYKPIDLFTYLLIKFWEIN